MQVETTQKRSKNKKERKKGRKGQTRVFRKAHGEGNTLELLSKQISHCENEQEGCLLKPLSIDN